MITRESYLEALDIVESYHQQLRQNKVECNPKSWNNLKIGDKIIFDRTLSKNALIGKEYEVIFVENDWQKEYTSRFGLIGEDGKEKYLRKHSRGYRVRVI